MRTIHSLIVLAVACGNRAADSTASQPVSDEPATPPVPALSIEPTSVREPEPVVAPRVLVHAAGNGEDVQSASTQLLQDLRGKLGAASSENACLQELQRYLAHQPDSGYPASITVDIYASMWRVSTGVHEGTGVSSSWSQQATFLATGTCEVVGEISSGNADGVPISNVFVRGDRERVVEMLRTSGVPVVSMNEIGGAFVSLVAGGIRGVARPRALQPSGAEQGANVVVVGPLYATQPWFSGEPRALPRALISTTTMPSRTVAAMALHVDDGERTPHYFASPGFGRAATSFTAGVYRLHTFAIPNSRFGAVAVALYNTETDQHKWILESAHAVSASDVTWFGAAQGLAFATLGVCHPSRGDCGGLAMLRLLDGALFYVEIPGYYEDGQNLHEVDDESALRQSCPDHDRRCVARFPRRFRVERGDVVLRVGVGDALRIPIVDLRACLRAATQCSEADMPTIGNIISLDE